MLGLQEEESGSVVGGSVLVVGGSVLVVGLMAAEVAMLVLLEDLEVVGLQKEVGREAESFRWVVG